MKWRALDVHSHSRPNGGSVTCYERIAGSNNPEGGTIYRLVTSNIEDINKYRNIIGAVGAFFPADENNSNTVTPGDPAGSLSVEPNYHYVIHRGTTNANDDTGTVDPVTIAGYKYPPGGSGIMEPLLNGRKGNSPAAGVARYPLSEDQMKSNAGGYYTNNLTIVEGAKDRDTNRRYTPTILFNVDASTLAINDEQMRIAVENIGLLIDALFALDVDNVYGPNNTLRNEYNAVNEFWNHSPFINGNESIQWPPYGGEYNKSYWNTADGHFFYWNPPTKYNVGYYGTYSNFDTYVNKYNRYYAVYDGMKLYELAEYWLDEEESARANLAAAQAILITEGFLAQTDNIFEHVGIYTHATRFTHPEDHGYRGSTRTMTDGNIVNYEPVVHVDVYYGEPNAGVEPATKSDGTTDNISVTTAGKTYTYKNVYGTKIDNVTPIKFYPYVQMYYDTILPAQNDQTINVLGGHQSEFKPNDFIEIGTYNKPLPGDGESAGLLLAGTQVC
jgi:hypothetical protein